MMILITGGAKCGKSRIAERLTDCGLRKFYIAAMERDGEDALKAIERHRKQREGKNFITIEKPRNIHEIALPANSAALLECMSTLCANEMFTSDGICDPTEKIIEGIKNLRKQARRLIIVTNNVGCDGAEYPSETAEYIRVLGAINQCLAQRADTVIEAVCGIPVLMKGELP